MKKAKDAGSDQSGEVMLEAAIIMVPVIVLLLAMLSLGFWFYQTSIMTTIAADIAEDVAANVKFESLAGHGDMVDLEDLTTTRMFRSTFAAGRVKNAQKRRAQERAEWRIPLSTLGFGSQDPELELELKSSGAGRTHVKVTLRQQTDFFLSGILKYTGIVDEDHPMFAGTAYAECVDLTEYTSMVNFARYAADEFHVFEPFGNLYVKVRDLLNALGIIS